MPIYAIHPDQPEPPDPRRGEHIQWCREMARPFLDRGDWKAAFTNFVAAVRTLGEDRDRYQLVEGRNILEETPLYLILSRMRTWIEEYE